MVVHAAAPCPVAVKEQMIEWWGPVIHEYYAGTEGNGFVYCNSEDWLAHKGTVGQALLGVIHIVDEDGDELPGRRGRARSTSSGGGEFEYHNDPEKTASSRNAEGWSTLGDIGHLDEDGFLYLTDRKAYMIISGGVNIYPQEAENVLVDAPQGVRRRRVRRAQRGLRRGGQGRRAAGRHGRRRPRARARAHRLLPRAPGRRQVPPLGRLPAPSCPATPPASSTSACSRTSTGKATSPASSDR